MSSLFDLHAVSRRSFLGGLAASSALVVLHPFSVKAAANQAHLRLMETTDVHVNLLPYDYYADKPVDTLGLSRTASLIDAMSQRTLATNWKKATKQEKEKFIDLFSQLIENTYIGKIEAYTNEKVEYPGEKVKGNKALVETLIIAASADIPVDYKLYKKGDTWWVYDVIIEGVSLISNYRSSYQEIVKKEGFDGLLAKMQEKIDELASEPPAAPADTAAAS